MYGNNNIGKFSVYQGEPITMTLTAEDNGHYVPDLSSNIYEALLKDLFNKTVKTWSSELGTISFSSITIGDQTAGTATFGMDGSETADLGGGTYTIEIAKVIPGGRAIGVMNGIISIVNDNIKRGV